AAIFAIATVWTIQIKEPAGHAPLPSRQYEEGRAMGAEPKQASLFGGILEGGRYLWGNRPVRTVMAIVLIPSFLGQPFTSLLPIFAKDVLAVGPQGQGMMLTALGLGALVGAVVIATAGNTDRQGLF